jgi:hypothetical protein
MFRFFPVALHLIPALVREVLMFKTACRLTLALCLSIVLVAAQSQPPATYSAVAAPKTELATITGRVVRSTDGEPLKKATVVAMLAQTGQTGQTGPLRPKSMITGADGKFVLKDLEPGRYMLTAMRNGYTRQAYGQREPYGPGSAITLVAGQELKDVDFRMISAGVIAGRIVDEDGEPLYQARIEAQRWMYLRGKRQLIPGGFAETNDLGEYRLSQLTPGRYFISANVNEQFQQFPGKASAEAHQGYSQTFYPGVYDASQADSLELKGGAEIGGINIRLVPSHAVTVRGTVKGTTQKDGVNVQLFPKTTGYRRIDRVVMVDEKGEFEIGGVLPGAYTVIAISFADDKRMSAMQTIDVADSDIDGINLFVKPSADIPGRLRIEGDLTIKNASIRVVLRSEDPATMFGGMPGTLQDDLSFTMKGYADGDYRVSVFGLPEDAYVKAAYMGSRDVLNEPLHLTGAVRPLEIVVSANGGRVEGAVTDIKSNPFPGARVVLVPDEARRKRQELYKSGNTDQYGRFNLRGVTPGAYTIYAWESLDGDAYVDPDFLKAYADAGKPVRVSESSRVTADLKVIPDQKPEGN